jgi:NADH:ubiquinone oxidoreductase subunit E
MATDLTRVDTIVDKHGTDKGALVAILIDIQESFSCLPPEALRTVAKRMGLPVMRVYQVARFYRTFTFQTRAQHLISVCEGTACYARESAPLVREIGRLLHIKPGEATGDGRFTLETANCPGSCPAGPVMIVDGKPHGRVTPGQVASILKPYMSAQETKAHE